MTITTQLRNEVVQEQIKDLDYDKIKELAEKESNHSKAI